MSRRLVDLSLLVIGLALGATLIAPPAPARAGEAGSPQTFAVTAPGPSPGQNVLYVVDPISMRLLVYEHRVGAKLRLFAVRNMEYDARFQQFPGDDRRVHEPTVGWVKDQVK